MELEIIIGLLSLFIITAFTNVLKTLKTILMAKKIMNPVYLFVFLDSMVFATILSKVTSSEGIQYTIAFALGKTVGVYLGGKVEDRLALGILEVDLFLNDEIKSSLIAQKLRETGYTVNKFLVNGNNGEERYQIEIVLDRKELGHLKSIISSYDVEDPTLKIKTLNNVQGKITTRRKLKEA